MKIRGEALELALRIVLSCPCPVTNDEERQVFDYLRGLTPDEVADYAPVLAIFEATDTPLHGLADFTGWMAPAGAEPTIEREHVLRCNASSYHWQLAAQSLPSHSRHVSSVSCWLLSHTVIRSRWRRRPTVRRRRSTVTRAVRRRSTTSFCRPSSIRMRRRRGRSISAPSSVRWALLRPRSSRSWARRIRSWCCTAAASRASITPTSSSWATTASSAARVTRRTSVARPAARAGNPSGRHPGVVGTPSRAASRWRSTSSFAHSNPGCCLSVNMTAFSSWAASRPPSSGSACPRIETRT